MYQWPVLKFCCVFTHCTMEVIGLGRWLSSEEPLPLQHRTHRLETAGPGHAHMSLLSEGGRNWRIMGAHWLMATLAWGRELVSREICGWVTEKGTTSSPLAPLPASKQHTWLCTPHFHTSHYTHALHTHLNFRILWSSNELIHNFVMPIIVTIP